MKTIVHKYAAALNWAGASGDGTSDYASYRRDFIVRVAGKPDLAGSADRRFRGAPSVHNPEDWMLAAVAGCHMLTYLALCARRGVVVTSYVDEPHGEVEFDASGLGRFTEIQLRPVVVVAESTMRELAWQLHEHANKACVIANSCRFVVHHDAEVRTQERQHERL